MGWTISLNIWLLGDIRPESIQCLQYFDSRPQTSYYGEDHVISGSPESTHHLSSQKCVRDLHPVLELRCSNDLRIKTSCLFRRRQSASTSCRRQCTQKTARFDSSCGTPRVRSASDLSYLLTSGTLLSLLLYMI